MQICFVHKNNDGDIKSFEKLFKIYGMSIYLRPGRDNEDRCIKNRKYAFGFPGKIRVTRRIKKREGTPGKNKPCLL